MTFAKLLRSILGSLLVFACHPSFVSSYSDHHHHHHHHGHHHHHHQESHVQVADEVFLHVREYGDSKSGTAPVVLLVHGFPDLSLSWQYHAGTLASEGYFVVTPDLRAYGSSSMPKGVAEYGRQRLVSDIDALRRHYCGGENGSFAMIAGHDWGGVVVWSTLDAYGLVGDDKNIPIAKCAVILNAPHPQVFLEFVSKPKQAIKSWYIAYFQIPWLPEVMLYQTKILYHLVAYHITPLQQIESIDLNKTLAVYREALSDYDRIQAMLSYYRSIQAGLWREPGDTSPWTYLERLIQWIYAVPVEDPNAQEDSSSCQEESESDGIRIAIPILILWGDRDIALSKELATPPASVKHYAIEFFDAGHCVHWDKSIETAERMVAFTNAHNNKNKNNDNDNNGGDGAINLKVD